VNEVFCFGLGYSAAALVGRLRPQGWRVVGTSTTAEGAARRAGLADVTLRFDGARSEPEVAAALVTATHVLSSAPPGFGGDPVLARHAADLAALPRLKWIGYLSTVGVYGDWHGGWVDEASELRPASERSKRRVAAERQWLDFGARTGRTVQVFRLSGIYGPGRSAIDNLRDGTARRIIKRDQVFNRIHVEDIARTLEAAMRGIGRHSIYNVTDDEPAPPQDVVEFAARLIGAPVPPDLPFEQAEMSPMGRSFYGENKRVANRRLKDDLRLTLAFPSYREGLRAVLEAG
jgi:nucleoside-diphosphate-sugar epimerase